MVAGENVLSGLGERDAILSPICGERHTGDQAALFESVEELRHGGAVHAEFDGEFQLGEAVDGLNLREGTAFPRGRSDR